MFTFIQEFQGFISPGILAVFLFGLFVRRAPPVCGVVGLLANPVCYWLMKQLLPTLAFLDRMAVSFGCVLLLMAAITVVRPLAEPRALPSSTRIELISSRGAKLCGTLVVVTALLLYIVFW